MKKLWNDRIFRTFIETIIGTIAGFFMSNNILDTDNKVLIGLLISAISTAVARVLPLLDEEEK